MLTEYHVPGVTALTKAGDERGVTETRLPGRILIFDTAHTAEDIMRDAFEAGVAHLPVVDFRSDPHPRADAAPGPVSDAAIEDALRATSVMAERCGELPPLGARPDSIGLQILGAAYVRTGHIEAAWAPDRPEMVDYPLLTGLGNPRAQLENLADAGLLERRFFDRLHRCGSCGSSRLNVREECVHCYSSMLTEESLLHHYRCAYQGLENEFISGDRLICPKCRRELRHYGVDYDRPGSVFHCRACGETMTEPAVGFLCADCGAHTLAEAAGLEEWHHYVLTGEGRTALLAGQLPVRSLVETLQRVIPGTLSQRHFALILAMQRRIAERYDRPLAGWRLTVSPTEDARNNGALDMDGVFRLVAEVVAQEVRDCDAVTAGEDEVRVLMPETDRDHAQIAIDRVRATLKEKISEAVTFSIDSAEGDELGELFD